MVAYDSDIGFKYGALANFFWYGDGSRYPMYNHSVYVEWSQTTKGNGINLFKYDSDQLIPGVRTFVELALRTEKALDFYGFNGFQSIYDQDFEAGKDADGLANRLYYRHARKLLRIKADFQGPITGPEFRWLGGVAFFGNRISAVDTEKLNEGKTDDLLSANSLYKDYVSWGVIPEDQADGGNHTLLKGGLVYDSRDNESNPFRGIWTEMQLHYAPSFLSNRAYSYTRLVFTHRQYFTLIPEWMSFAYRLSYQGKLSGEMPFYMMPYLFNTAPALASDGVGGAKSVRGIRRNRIVGEGFAYGNFEFRGKILKTRIWNQDFYIALSAFLDACMVTQKYRFEQSGILVEESLAGDLPPVLFDFDARERPHLGYGAGIRFALNENFIVAVDYGLAGNKTDGDSGLYIGMDFLF